MTAQWNSTFQQQQQHNCTIEERTLLEFVIYGLLLNFVGLLGIMGNSISVIVLSRPQMRSSINYLLIGLATCDTVLIVLAVCTHFKLLRQNYTYILFTIVILFITNL